MSKRCYHKSALVKGALFMTGGLDGSWTTLSSTVFVYGNGTIETGPQLPEARSGHCMVTLHDGKVLILGANPNSPSLYKNVIIFTRPKTHLPMDRHWAKTETMLHAHCLIAIYMITDLLSWQQADGAKPLRKSMTTLMTMHGKQVYTLSFLDSSQNWPVHYQFLIYWIGNIPQP